MKAIPLKKTDRKTKKVVGIRWRFEEYNPMTQRNEPVPVDQIPEHIRNSQDKDEVQAYVKSQDAKTDALKHRAERMRAWREKYHDFNDYLEKFEKSQRDRAPNSYENDVHYLEQYAFGFFLSKSNLNNMNEWSLMFDDFREWLKTVKPLKYNIKTLSKNTQIKVIKALNCFLTFAAKKGWIDGQPKCPTYSREETICPVPGNRCQRRLT